MINEPAKAGGIEDNSRYPVDYMMTNIKIQTNLIDFYAINIKLKNFYLLVLLVCIQNLVKIPIKETEPIKR